MDVKRNLMLAAEMEREINLSRAAVNAAQTELYLTCLSNDSQKIEEVRLKAIETYSAALDVIIKWTQKINREKMHSRN